MVLENQERTKWMPFTITVDNVDRTTAEVTNEVRKQLTRLGFAVYRPALAVPDGSKSATAATIGTLVVSGALTANTIRECSHF